MCGGRFRQKSVMGSGRETSAVGWTFVCVYVRMTCCPLRSDHDDDRMIRCATEISQWRQYDSVSASLIRDRILFIYFLIKF